MNDADARPATPTEIGNAIAVTATVTIGAAVERVLTALGIAIVVVDVLTRAAVSVAIGELYSGQGLFPGVGASLLIAAFIHKLLRRKASTPDLGS